MKTYHFTRNGDLRFRRKRDASRSDAAGIVAWLLISLAVWSVLAVRAAWV